MRSFVRLLATCNAITARTHAQSLLHSMQILVLLMIDVEGLTLGGQWSGPKSLEPWIEIVVVEISARESIRG
jgi:hypothetical protein